MAFFFFAFTFLYIGRKVGWALCRWKGGFYNEKLDIEGVAWYCLLWGAGVALCIAGLLHWQQPNVWLRWIMGYAAGSYVAIPNFGLLREDSIPPEVRRRHRIITNVPFWAYVAASIGIANTKDFF